MVPDTGHRGRIIGDLPDTCGRDADYFLYRDTFIYCAEGRLVVHPNTFWGWRVTVVTGSHDLTGGYFTGVGDDYVDRGVQVDDGAFIGSAACLYNCHVGEFAIVAFGTVVRSQEVLPRTIVAGNPASTVAHWNGSSWDWLIPKYERLEFRNWES